MLYKRLAAGAAAALIVGSGSMVGFRASVPQQAMARADYSAPQVTLTDSQFPDGFGPGNGTTVDATLINAMSDGLVVIDNKLNVVPDLATELPSTKNGGVKTVSGNLQVTWHIKPNQKWADGTPLTADQAIFAIKITETPDAGYASGYDVISKASAPDPRTIMITYKGIYGSYLYNAPGFYNYMGEAKKYGVGDVSQYAKSDYDAASWQKTVADAQGNTAASFKSTTLSQLITKWQADAFTKPDDAYWNGPYKLGTFVADQRVEIVPNPLYNALGPAMSGGKALPRPSKIVLVSVSQNASGYIAALQAPDVAVDKAENFQESDIPALQRITRFHLTVQPQLSLEHLELNRNNKFLADLKVRQALELAVNKVALVHAAFPAVANPAANVVNTFMPKSHPYADRSVDSEFNVAKAKQLLRSGGYCTPDVQGGCKQIFLNFYTTPRSPRPKVGEILKRDWAQIGVTLKLNTPRAPYDNGGLFASWDKNGINVHRSGDVTLFAWVISPDPDSARTFFDPKFIPTASGAHNANTVNYAGVDDPIVTNAFKQGAASLDSATQHKWYNIAQQRVADQVYWIPLFVRNNITIDNGKIINFKPNPSATGNSWNTWEWSKAAQ